MISCKRATQLISKQMDEPLSLSEDLSLKLHLFICECCEKFRQQSKFVRKMLGLLKSQDFEALQENFPTKAACAAKERLKKKLRPVGRDH